MSWISRIVNVFRPSSLDRVLDDEITFHLDSRIEELVRGGMPRGEAEAMARRQFGSPLRVREASRDVKVMRWLDDGVRDVRHGLRMLRRTPVFATVAILTLALGIGATTAILSIVYGVLLRPLPYPRPDRLMHLTASAGLAPVPVSVAEYLELQQFSQSFSAVGAYRLGEANLAADGRALRVRSAIVDHALLRALGASVAAGRLFTSNDSVVAAPALPGGSASAVPVALISHELWQSAFGARPMVGERMSLDGRRVEVIGVMPSGLDLMDTHPDVWLPLGFSEGERRARNNHNLGLIARLRDGVSEASAQAELRTLVDGWSARAGITPGAGHAGHVFGPNGFNGDRHALRMMPLADQILGRAGRAIWVLQAAVGFVLLIACANVVNLLLARGETRRREFALLTALGAGRGRLLRKATAESVVLSVCGGALGVLLARVGVDALVRTYPASLPRLGDVAVDLRIALVALAIAVGCGLFFGLAPMLHAGRDAALDALKSGARGAIGSPRHRIRRLLVVGEVALAVIVVVGAGLLVRTVRNLTAVDAGFDRSRLVTFSVTLPRDTFDYLARVRTYQRLLDELRAIPGVRAATAVTGLPLDRQVLGNQTEITGSASAVELIPIEYQRVMSGFFETMGIAIVQGRGFHSTDADADGGVAIVNETLARTYWPGGTPVGQRLRPASTKPWFTVIGVAKDIKQAGIDQPVGAEVYVLVDQFTTPPQSWVAISPTLMNVVARTDLPLTALALSIGGVVRGIDPSLPVARLREMGTVFDESIRRPRLLSQLLALFSTLALTLAAIGTYGVLASMVAERRRELGIRLALGADRGRLLRDVLRQGLSLAGAGAVIGMAVALGLTRGLSSLLYGVRSSDVMTFAAALAAILAVAGIASWLPAWRASRLDPNIVLRVE